MTAVIADAPGSRAGMPMSLAAILEERLQTLMSRPDTNANHLKAIGRLLADTRPRP